MKETRSQNTAPPTCNLKEGPWREKFREPHPSPVRIDFCEFPFVLFLCLHSQPSILASKVRLFSFVMKVYPPSCHILIEAREGSVQNLKLEAQAVCATVYCLPQKDQSTLLDHSLVSWGLPPKAESQLTQWDGTFLLPQASEPAPVPVSLFPHLMLKFLRQENRSEAVLN